VVSLTFTVYDTASSYVSGVCVRNRGGPQVEGIQTRQLDAIRGHPNTLVAGGRLGSLPCVTRPTVRTGNGENFHPEASRLALRAANGYLRSVAGTE